MRRSIAARVLGVLGLVVLASTAVTALFGNTQLLLAKAVLGAAAVAAGFALGEPGGAKRFFTGRAAHFGLFTGLSAVLLAAILAVANWAAHKRPRTWDLTRNRIHTLSGDTLRTLGLLGEEVQALAFYGQADAGYAEAQELLRRYADRSSRFRFQMVDPFRSPELVKRYGITDSGPRIVMVRGKEEARAREPTEEALTNALVKVTRTRPRRVYLTQGHGEPPPRGDAPPGLSLTVRALEGEGLEVADLSLLERAEVPADADAVLVVGPRRPFLDPEVEALRRYLGRGGHLGVFLEPELNAGLDGLLKDWGIEADEDMVVDPSPVSRLFGGSPVTPIVKPSAAHPVTRDLAQVGLLFPTARSLVALRGGSVTPRPLALTGPDAWGETDVRSLYGSGARHDEGEKGGPLPVAMSSERALPAEGGRPGREARVAVVGDSDFLANQYQHLLGNRDFALNLASWLAEQEDRLTIRPRTREASRLLLTESQASTLRFLTVDALPVALLGLGLAVWLVRRSR
jgi:ABC-type uncharacterized transport system involved in gliding motility auxiliary subunit